MASALELARAMERAAPVGKQVVPIVVVISNDAEMSAHDLPAFMPHCAQPQPRLLTPALQEKLGAQRNSSTLEVLIPVLGLVATRGAHNQLGLIAAQRQL